MNGGDQGRPEPGVGTEVRHMRAVEGPPPGAVLVLGGTAEARELAAALDAGGVAVVSSLAGRVSRPRLPRGEVRVGGFGGPEGLTAWLREHDVAAVVDATHPFAERISASAAAALVEELGSRVLLTTGRQGLASFAGIGSAWFLVRCVEPPDPPLPPRSEVLLDRGPYELSGELELIDSHRVDLVVTKDSGGAHTSAKLDAARERGLPVVVVRRPPRLAVPTVATVDEALDWLRGAAQPG